MLGKKVVIEEFRKEGIAVERKSGGGSRKKRFTGDASGGGVFRRGSAVNPKAGKPVGRTDGYADRKQGSITSHKSFVAELQYILPLKPALLSLGIKPE